MVWIAESVFIASLPKKLADAFLVAVSWPFLAAFSLKLQFDGILNNKERFCPRQVFS